METIRAEKKRKKVAHQISLIGTGGMQRSFMAYYALARGRSIFSHTMFGLYDIGKDYISLAPDYANISKSIRSKIYFLYQLADTNTIVHFYNNLISKSVHRLLKYFPSSRIILHERGIAWNVPQRDKDICRENAEKALMVLANSYATKTMLIKKFGIPGKIIKVVYNGFLNPGDVTPSTICRKKGDKKVVGFLGRFDLPKGAHTFVKLARRLAKRKDMVFRMGGSGFLEDYLKDEIRECGNIEYKGRTREPMEFLKGLDILIVPSIREPLGNVIIEAGYLKKPVIASNVDGIPEIIDDGLSGVLLDPIRKISLPDFSSLPPESPPIPEYVIDPLKKELRAPGELDVSELENAVVSLLNNPERMKGLAESLYEKVTSIFTLDNYFNSLEDIYKGVFDIR